MNTFKDLFQKYSSLIFFDTETTGLNPKYNQIIELAAIKVNCEVDGTLNIIKSIDDFIKLPNGKQLPKEIERLTKITNELLANSGISESDAFNNFENLIINEDGSSVLIAYNAQFDLRFIIEISKRCASSCLNHINNADYLDALTVYKDRKEYPHKLSDAINEYKLTNKVKNSHRAIDDVMALFEVCKAMDKEKPNLLTYVNKFGFNPKYGVSGERINKVNYFPQI